MTTFHIVGLDLSLTATGVARIRVGDGIEGRWIRVDVVGSSPVRNAQYPDTLARLRSLAARVVRKAREGAEEGDVIVFAIEGPILANPSGGQAQAHVHTRAGFWWLVYHLVEKLGLVVVVEPSKLKRYVTGKGNTPKDGVLSAVVRLFPDVDVTDNNEADGLGLASMVARELGFPMEPSVQRVTPAALDGIHWPEQITQRREHGA